MEHMKAYLRDRSRSLLLQLSSFAILLLVLLLYRLPVKLWLTPPPSVPSLMQEPDSGIFFAGAAGTTGCKIWSRRF